VGYENGCESAATIEGRANGVRFCPRGFVGFACGLDGELEPRTWGLDEEPRPTPGMSNELDTISTSSPSLSGSLRLGILSKPTL
jgi:hypothetical protein